MTLTATLEGPEMAKRKYGTGGVRKRGNTWEIYYRPKPGGERIFETVGSERKGITEEDAQHLLMERLVQIGRGEGDVFLGHRFQDVALEWRSHVKAMGNLSNRTMELYDNSLYVHLLPAFSEDFLHQIDSPVIERYCSKKLTLAPGEKGAVPVEGEAANNLGRPIGRRSVEQQLSVLNLIFKYAVRHKKMIRNPVAEVEITKGNKKKKKVEPLEQDQVKELLMQARNEEEETLFLLLSSTGLRLGEALALQVKDFRDKDQVLRISRTQTKEGGKTVISSSGKTGAAQRDLKVSDYLAMRIRRQIARAEKRCENEDTKLLFPNGKGRLQAESNFRNRIFYPALQRAGLDGNGYTPHTLRHTAASEFIAAGLPDTQIAYFLGHASPQITRTIYAHIFDRHRESIADLSDIYSHTPIDEL